MTAPPTTETMKISDVKQQLNSLVNRVYRRETRVLVEKSGIPVAGIVSAQDLQRLERLDRERAERFKILDEIGEAFKDVPFEELEREIARAIAEVRAERRAEQVVGAGT
ncbi:MAG: type II toxin-antitoxin system prevent-host-death family antitoxin [Thermomicrobiales bacterium]